MMSKTLSALRASVAVFLLAANVLANSEIDLKNGDRVSGNIVAETEAAVTVETPYAGKITIAREHIKSISKNSEAATTATSVAAESKSIKPAQTDKEAAQAFNGRATGFLQGWEGNANIGFSFTSGNSNYTTMSTGLRATKAGPHDSLTVYARSHWNKNRSGSSHVTTQNAFWGGARYDRSLTEKTFGFVSYDFERDRPKKLNFRSVAGGGVGRHFIRNEHTQLDLLVGAAWNRTWEVESNTDSPEGIAGLTFKHRINDRLRVQSSVNVFQNVTDMSEFRSIVDATLTVDLTKRIGVFINLGDRFNSDPAGGARNNDFLLNTGIKWNFGRKGR